MRRTARVLAFRRRCDSRLPRGRGDQPVALRVASGLGLRGPEPPLLAQQRRGERAAVRVVAGRDADTLSRSPAPSRCWFPRAACGRRPTRDTPRAWLAVVALAVFGVYSAYTPFDAWWYLRFLLPAWPAAVHRDGRAARRTRSRAGRVVPRGWSRLPCSRSACTRPRPRGASACIRRAKGSGATPRSPSSSHASPIRRARSSRQRTSAPCGTTVGG